MKWSNIFVVTYGRTGSTLLMGLLNSYEGIKVKGENFNFIKGLYLTYKQLLQLKEQYGHQVQDVTDPFYGAESTNIATYIETVRSLIKQQLLTEQDHNIKCWGFKEIRYIPKELTIDGQYDLKGYLDFLKIIFPDAGFIFLSRNHSDVAKSAFWESTNTASVISTFEKVDVEFKKWSKSREDTFFIDYKDMVNKNENLQSMHDFIGVSFDITHVSEVMSIEYSYGNKNGVTQKVSERKIFELSDIVEVKLDEKNSAVNLSAESKYHKLSGVIVLSAMRNSADYRLVAIADSQGEKKTVNWEISSPVFSKKYPNNNNASTARFVIESSFSKHLKIYLEDADFNRQLIIQLTK